MTEEKKITGMAYMLHAITSILTKIDDFVTEDNEVIEIKNTGEFVLEGGFAKESKEGDMADN